MLVCEIESVSLELEEITVKLRRQATFPWTFRFSFHRSVVLCLWNALCGTTQAQERRHCQPQKSRENETRARSA